MLIDWKDNRIVLVSSTGVSLREIGRLGSGPGEFRQPIELIALRGDTTAIVDQELRRILFVDPAGTTRESMLFPQEFSPGLLFSRAADARGRFTFTPNWISTRLDGAAEMVPVLAWDRSSNRADTAAMILAGAKVSIERKDATGRVVATSTFPIRYGPADEWAMLSTGDVAVLHSEPFSVDIVTRGTIRVRGPRLSYEKVRVESTERIPPPIADIIPSHKPAFTGTSAIAGANGEVWINRSQAATATVRVYDQFDRAARRVGSVTMERAIVITAFGRNAMYTVRTDADGMQWLEKRPLPR